MPGQHRQQRHTRQDAHNHGRYQQFEFRKFDVFAEPEPGGRGRKEVDHHHQRYDGLQRQEMHQERDRDQRGAESGDSEDDVGEQPDQGDRDQGFDGEGHGDLADLFQV